MKALNFIIKGLIIYGLFLIVIKFEPISFWDVFKLFKKQPAATTQVQSFSPADFSEINRINEKSLELTKQIILKEIERSKQNALLEIEMKKFVAFNDLKSDVTVKNDTVYITRTNDNTLTRIYNKLRDAAPQYALAQYTIKILE